MNLTQALSNIHAPKGQTSVIAGLLSGETDSISGPRQGQGLEHARTELARVKEAQANCESDWAYWGYEGDKSYWSAVVSILEAAELVGPENLPDIPFPETGNKVVMDACYEIAKFGQAILAAARAKTP